jgi:hypothetical protein
VFRSSNPAGGQRPDNTKSPKRIWRKLLIGVLLFVFTSGLILAIVPVLSPALGADIADQLRAIFGPQPVALLESVSFHLQDALNQVRTKINGGQVQISVSNLPQNSFATPTPQAPASVSNQSAPPLSINAVTDNPQLGWKAYGPDINGAPAMAEAIVLLDPQRSYAGVVLVRIDLSKIQLHMMPGYLEPSHSSAVVQAIPQLGMIPTQDQNNLIAAFNGGFKAIHGHYGMMVDAVTLVKPQAGLATVALYQDGHVQIGVWGKDMNQTPDMIAFRQNCPPLIAAGQINADLSHDNRKAWGYTGNSDITWRTGMGITQDRRYLIYAVGNGTSAQTLANALQKAGAYYAMQLDINQFYAHFYLYQPSDPATSKGFSLTGTRLVDQMINNPHLYLTPNVRDFFYLTEMAKVN